MSLHSLAPEASASTSFAIRANRTAFYHVRGFLGKFKREVRRRWGVPRLTQELAENSARSGYVSLPPAKPGSTVLRSMVTIKYLMSLSTYGLPITPLTPL